MKLEKDFLFYLDSEGILNELKNAGCKFQSRIRSFLMDGIFIPPFRFMIKIDLIRLQEMSYELYTLFIKEPDKCIKIARDVSYHTLRELTDLKDISKSDVQIKFCVASLPSGLALSSFREPFQGLKIIDGVLIARTAIQKYARSKVFFCSNSTCFNHSGRRYEPPFSNICPLCNSQMKENLRSLDTGEEIFGQIVCLTAFECNGRFQTTRIRFTDEICYSVNLQIGEEYNLIVSCEDSQFRVWYVGCKQTGFEMFSLRKLENLTIPNSIAKLYYRISANCAVSSWSFVGTISAYLGSDVLPVSSFLQLKMGLMLSLATQNSEDAPVPIVVVGSDFSAVQKLVRRAGRLAERYINYTAGYEQLGGDKRHSAREEVWYEAGAMILATKGVCSVGDWSRFRKDQCNYICQAVESGKIILNNPDKGKTEAEFVPLRCSIWTYWCHISSTNQDQLQLKTLINVFGVPFLADENNEIEAERLSNKILELSMPEAMNDRDTDFWAVPDSDLKEFISLANAGHLILSESASKLIHDFFVIIRRETPECLPVGAIKTITALAEAHARLSLKNEIDYEDVVAVLYLYNESISVISGSPLITIERSNYDQSQPICKYIHDNIEKFRISLEKYLENHLYI